MSLDISLVKHNVGDPRRMWLGEVLQILEDKGASYDLVTLVENGVCEEMDVPFETETVYWANITSNLRAMARAVGADAVLWGLPAAPLRACDILPVLQQGMLRLEESPGDYREYEASNGWGTVEQFLGFLRHLALACEANEDALVEVSY